MRIIPPVPAVLIGFILALVTGKASIPAAYLPAGALLLSLLPRGQRVLILFLIGLAGGVLLKPGSEANAPGPRSLRECACLTRWVEGRVVSVRTNGRRGRFILEVQQARLIRLETLSVSGRLLVFHPRRETPVRRGEYLRIHGESRPLGDSPDPLLPSAAVFRPDSIRRLPEPSSLQRGVNHTRRGLQGIFTRARRLGPFLNAVFLGDRGALDRERLRPFRRTGIAHVLAVSGFHVALLAGLMTLFTIRLPGFAAVPIELGILLLYTILTGGGPSILRAAILFSLRRLLPGRHALSLLAACALGLLAARPALLHSTAALLSFTASAGILLFSKKIAGLPLFRRLPDLLVCPFAASLAAQVALVPLLAAAFGEVSLIAPLANPVLLPLFLAGCLLALPGVLLASLGLSLPLEAAETLFSLFEGLARAAGNLPFAAVGTPGWTSDHTLLWYGTLALLAAGASLGAARRRERYRRELAEILPPGLLAAGGEDEYICPSPDQRTGQSRTGSNGCDSPG